MLMATLFYDILTRARDTRQLVELRFQEQPPERFYLGFIKSISESAVCLHALSPDGYTDSYVIARPETVASIDLDSVYSRKMALLADAPLVIPAPTFDRPDLEEEASFFGYLKQSFEAARLVTLELRSQEVLSGYMETITLEEYLMASLSANGELEARIYGRLDDVERIYFGGIEQARLELFFRNQQAIRPPRAPNT
jgi:hypothetical protein